MELMNFCSSKAVIQIKFAVSHCVLSSADRKEFVRCSEEEVTKKGIFRVNYCTHPWHSFVTGVTII